LSTRAEASAKGAPLLVSDIIASIDALQRDEESMTHTRFEYGEYGDIYGGDQKIGMLMSWKLEATKGKPIRDWFAEAVINPEFDVDIADWDGKDVRCVFQTVEDLWNWEGIGTLRFNDDADKSRIEGHGNLEPVNKRTGLSFDGFA
jgi:hypothetical protein